MTPLPGAGALPEVAGPEEPEPLEPEPPEPDDPVDVTSSSLSCCANGSLLAKRENEASCPSCPTGAPEDASEPALLLELAAGCSAPASVGAASEGVPLDVEVVVDAARMGGGFG